MKQPSAAPRAARRTAGVNSLITVVSLALTVGGWAVLARSEANQSLPSAGAPPVAAGRQPALPALPTIVPVPESGLSGDRPGGPVTAAAPPLIPEAPTPLAPPAGVRPPVPTAVTRSSR